MKIRAKLSLITGAFFISVLLIATLAVWTINQVESLKDTTNRGVELVSESKNVRALLLDLLFGMFSPQMYDLLKDLTYAPRPYTTPREWIDSVASFKADFRTFMALPSVKRLLRNQDMRNEYQAALAVSEKAFRKIDGLNLTLTKLVKSGVIGNKDLYETIQENPQDPEISFFDEVRATSYYLTNNFESFLNYFLRSLEIESRIIQRQMILTFLILTIVIGLSTFSIALIFARRITGSIQSVEAAIRRVSMGDFSTRLVIASHDEFEKLSDNLNLFVSDLKRNVNTILDLTRDIGSSVAGLVSIDNILNLVVESIVKNTGASGAAILLADEMRQVLVTRAVTGRFPTPLDGSSGASPSGEEVPEATALPLGGRPFPLDHPIFGPPQSTGEPVFIYDSLTDDRMSGNRTEGLLFVSSLIAVPFVQAERVVGVLSIVSTRKDRRFTDLDLTNLRTFAEFAALTIDNFNKYVELIEKREAEYQALQSQVQPHFLYNVLAGLIGLNRMGRTKALESSILALKDMLRYTTEHQEWTTVAEEFQFLLKYCNLQKLRFHERLSFDLDCDEAAGRCRIPKLLLQPLVENAVIHGIEPLDRRGHLAVTARLNHSAADPVLHISIADDGVGFEPGPIVRRTHIGLGNVKERLALAFKRASFQIRSNPGDGTRVDIEISGEELSG